MRMTPVFRASLVLALLICMSATVAWAQITPSDDSYTLTSSPTVNFGAKNTLEVESAGATTFVRFDLSGIPSTVTGSMVAKATLKIYVSTVTTAGSFNVDLVTSPWTESTITANNTPTLGSAIASAVPVTTADKNKYVLVDVTTAAVDWLNGTANDGIAIVPDGTVSFALNSKETTTTSHPAELDIVYASGGGTITGVTTSSGSGLTGGGTSGTLSLSLTNACAANQILQWSGSAWACANPKGTGTITGVTAGTDLTGGGTSGNVTLNLDTTKVPQLATANTFVGNQSVAGTLTVAGSAFQPVTVQSTNGFGTWFALGNSSSGGHSWNIISAGGGNAEGAGNLGITDLTGKSTIFLEGNTNISAHASIGPGVYDRDQLKVVGDTADSGIAAIAATGATAIAGTDGETAIIATGGGGSSFHADGLGGVFQGGHLTVNGTGIYSQAGSGNAGDFAGDVYIGGNLSKSGGSFKIDHPLDPANKYLYHSFVESPDMMNIYNGNVVTDANGDAFIPLPEWFERLNRDFRYQLTVIGQFAQAIVTGEVANHQFSIKTDKPGVKVSWQVTGIRQDPWANAHRIPVEEEKNARERGHYIRPELYGAPEEAGIDWARYPEIMKRLKEIREQNSRLQQNSGRADSAVADKR